MVIMKYYYKNIVAGLIVLVVVITCVNVLLAQEQTGDINAIVHSVNGYDRRYVDGVEIIISEQADAVTNDIIRDILAGYPSAVSVTFYAASIAEDADSFSEKTELAKFQEAPGDFITYIRSKKTATLPDYEVEYKWCFSSAKGMIATTSKTFSASHSGSLTGIPYNFELLGSTDTLTAQYTAGTAFVGPPESSPANSRSYYILSREGRGNYTQYKDYIDVYSGEIFTIETHGTYRSPTRVQLFSIDEII